MRVLRPFAQRCAFSLFFAPLTALVFSPLASGGDIWDGGGADANWTTGNNWDGGIGRLQFPPPNNGTANVHFVGNDNTFPVIDTPYSVNSVTFDAGSVSFIHTGQELTIGAGGITNNDNSSQLILAPIKLAAPQYWTTAAGPMQFGPVNLNGHGINFTGGYFMTIGNAITGSGAMSLNSSLASTVTLSGNASNTFDGIIYVVGGTLVMQKTGGAVAVPGGLVIRNGTVARLGGDEQIGESDYHVTVDAGGLLDINTHTETVRHLEVHGQVVTTGAGRLTAADAVVSGVGATWTNAGPLYIGDTGVGALDIGSNGLVTNTHGYIGHQAGSMGMVTINGSMAKWENSGNLYVGNAGAGMLNVDLGAVTVGGNAFVNAASAVDFRGSLSITGNLDASGRIRINGANVGFAAGVIRSGGVFEVNSECRVIHAGMLDLESNATLNIRGAIADYKPHFLRVGTTPGAPANFFVGGFLSKVTSDFAIDVGYGGTGVMTVVQGAEVSSVTGAVGSFDGGVGTLELRGRGVDGLPTQWVIDELNMGLSPTSQGTVSVTQGALLQANLLAVGTPGAGHVFVDGVDSPGNPSRLSVTNLSIGQGGFGNGTGDVTARNGGRIEVSGIGIGYLGGVGSLTVTDPGSTLVQPSTGYLTLGHATAGMGSVNILEGGVYTSGTNFINVEARGAMTISGVAAQGRFNANGLMTVRGAVTVGDLPSGVGGFLDVNAGLTIDAGRVTLKQGVIDANTITQMNGGALDMQGGLLHVDTFTGNLVNDAGTMAPGHSIGATAVTGSYAQHEDARLEIEIGGVAPGQWDTLAVGGNAILNGAIEVKLVDGFEPVLGNSFTIITTNAGNVGGPFDQLILPLVNGVSFDVVYNPKGVVLVARPGFTADFDDDGDVDGDDLVQWQGDFGANAQSDADADGDSDGADFLAWQRQLGSAAPATAASVAAPEPAALVLALAMVAAVAARTRATRYRS
jgi:T5SS/PEP-CTERM-associated repeat protein/autotransporter-associated beta strand protein